jgi:DNA-binding NarL/FixJ family response regulator
MNIPIAAGQRAKGPRALGSQPREAKKRALTTRDGQHDGSLDAGAKRRAQNPLGAIETRNIPPAGSDLYEILSTPSDAIPAWQHDACQQIVVNPAASPQRNAVLKRISERNQFGVIFDRTGSIVQGTSDWTKQLHKLPSLTLKNNRLAPTSHQSELEFQAAINLLFQDYKLASLPVALRDLDGWVCDVLHIHRVGLANPDLAYAILPRSQSDLNAIAEGLALPFGLSPFETSLTGLLAKGDSAREMALALNVKLSVVQRGIRQVLTKFKVRQTSDIVRIFSTFP